MNNKDVSAQFLYKPHKVKNCLPRKISYCLPTEIYYSMYIKKRCSVKSQILLANFYILKNSSSVFNLSFQGFIHHPILSNNCINVFPAVLLLYSVTPGDVLEEEQPYFA